MKKPFAIRRLESGPPIKAAKQFVGTVNLERLADGMGPGELLCCNISGQETEHGMAAIYEFRECPAELRTLGVYAAQPFSDLELDFRAAAKKAKWIPLPERPQT